MTRTKEKDSINAALTAPESVIASSNKENEMTKPTVSQATVHDPVQALGGNIMAEMDRQQINRTQLAEILGWTAYKLGNRLSGKRLVLTDFLVISRALGVDMATLFAGEGADPISPGALRMQTHSKSDEHTVGGSYRRADHMVTAVE